MSFYVDFLKQTEKKKKKLPVWDEQEFNLHVMDFDGDDNIEGAYYDEDIFKLY
jgi:hypothetical protein